MSSFCETRKYPLIPQLVFYWVLFACNDVKITPRLISATGCSLAGVVVYTFCFHRLISIESNFTVIECVFHAIIRHRPIQTRYVKQCVLSSGL